MAEVWTKTDSDSACVWESIKFHWCCARTPHKHNTKAFDKFSIVSTQLPSVSAHSARCLLVVNDAVVGNLSHHWMDRITFTFFCVCALVQRRKHLSNPSEKFYAIISSTHTHTRCHPHGVFCDLRQWRLPLLCTKYIFHGSLCLDDGATEMTWDEDDDIITDNNITRANTLIKVVTFSRKDAPISLHSEFFYVRIQRTNNLLCAQRNVCHSCMRWGTDLEWAMSRYESSMCYVCAKNILVRQWKHFLRWMMMMKWTSKHIVHAWQSAWRGRAGVHSNE